MSWLPQPGPQALAIAAATQVHELFFGGARGGGKSFFLLLDFLQDIDLGRPWRGILFRRTYNEMDEVLRLCNEVFPTYGATYHIQERRWHFPSGATLTLRHIANVQDTELYRGHSYAWIGYDELTLWADPQVYHRLKATLRTGEAQVRCKRVRATGNPGGVGDSWVKDYFAIDEHPDGIVPLEATTPEGLTLVRMFIPSKVQDNQILLANDPGYIAALRASAGGDAQLLAAWLEGDWSAAVGTFFNMYRRGQVVVEPFVISPTWRLFGAMDYGETNPTAFALSAVDHDDNIYQIGMYYQAGLSATEHAENIRTFIKANVYTYGRRPTQIFADPSMWVKHRLDEQSARSAADVFTQHGLHLTPANNDRINGWRTCKDALINRRFFLFEGCNRDWERTVPFLPRDAAKPEDLDTHADDHAGDAWRYGMVHFYTPRPPELTPNTPGSRLIRDLLHDNIEMGQN